MTGESRQEFERDRHGETGDLYRELRELRQAHAALVAALEWQPIETAPEATWVLVIVPNYGMNIATMTRDPNILGQNGAFWFIRGEDDRSWPTHWMPLPAPPV